MNYVEKHLIPGESVQYQTKLHWIVMLGHIASAVFFALLAIVILVTRLASPKSSPSGSWMYLASLFCLAVAVVLAAFGFLKRNATEMAVTNKRIIVKNGILDRRTTELLLTRVESIAVEEPAMGRIFGYGTVIVRGIGGTPEAFEKIYHPLEFRQQVQSQIADERKAG